MHSPSHTPARDHDAPWSAEAKPAKRAKKKAAKKKSTAKTSAKKKSTKTSAKKKSTAKTSAKKKSSAEKSGAKKKSSAKKRPAAGAPDFSLSPEQLTARLEDPATLRRIIDVLQRQHATETAALRAEVSALTRKLAAVERTVDNLAANDTVALLADEVLDDPALRWLQDPSIEPYRGRHVAIDAARGVITGADSLREVIASVRAEGLSLDDVCLAFVPAAPF